MLAVIPLTFALLGGPGLAEWKAITAPVVEEHIHLPAIANRIASCESGDGRGSYSLTAENPVSSASGKYQFVRRTWESVSGRPAPASAYSERVQDAAFLALWDEGRGASHWAASRHCWG